MASHMQSYAVVGPQYCQPQETVLVMKGKIFTVRDAKEVRDANNHLHFRVADRLLSVRDKMTIENAQGEPVCTVVSKLVSLHDTAYICPGRSSNTDEYLVKAKKVILSMKPELKVFLKGNDTTHADIYVRGSFIGHDFKITTKDDALLAEVNQNMLDPRKFAFDAHTYFIRVMPGVDSALILALVGLTHATFVDED